MVVVAPMIDLWLTTNGDAIDNRAKNLASIYQEAGLTNAIVVVGFLAIVVCPQSKANPAPCGELTLNSKC